MTARVVRESAFAVLAAVLIALAILHSHDAPHMSASATPGQPGQLTMQFSTTGGMP
jgi:purine-cytosine permease-like protein